MVELLAPRLIEQPRELVERGDLNGAGAGQLLTDLLHLCLGSLANVRSEGSLPVGLGGLLRIDVERHQPWHSRHGRRLAGEAHPQHLIEVGGRVRADEQHAPARIGRTNGRRASERCLAHSAFAREEQVGGQSRGLHHDERPREVRVRAMKQVIPHCRYWSALLGNGQR
jgi:hypothetical protein